MNKLELIEKKIKSNELVLKGMELYEDCYKSLYMNLSNKKEEKNKNDTKQENKEKIAKTKIDPTKRPKTPAAPKPKMKEEKSNNKTVVKDKKEVKAKAGVAKSTVGGKAPAAKKDASKRPKTAKVDPKSKTL